MEVGIGPIFATITVADGMGSTALINLVNPVKSFSKIVEITVGPYAGLWRAPEGPCDLPRAERFPTNPFSLIFIGEVPSYGQKRVGEISDA